MSMITPATKGDAFRYQEALHVLAFKVAGTKKARHRRALVSCLNADLLEAGNIQTTIGTDFAIDRSGWHGGTENGSLDLSCA